MKVTFVSTCGLQRQSNEGKLSSNKATGHNTSKTILTRTFQSHVSEDPNDYVDQMRLYQVCMYYHFCNVMSVLQDIQHNHTNEREEGANEIVRRQFRHKR